MEGVAVVEQDGHWFFFFDPQGLGGARHRFPMATIVTSNAYDTHSDLDREGAFRINFGVDKETFVSLFGGRMSDLQRRDYAERDVLLPHPDYGAQFFVCVVNPERTLEQVRELLRLAHGVAARRDTGV